MLWPSIALVRRVERELRPIGRLSATSTLCTLDVLVEAARCRPSPGSEDLYHGSEVLEVGSAVAIEEVSDGVLAQLVGPREGPRTAVARTGDLSVKMSRQGPLQQQAGRLSSGEIAKVEACPSRLPAARLRCPIRWTAVAGRHLLFPFDRPVLGLPDEICVGRTDSRSHGRKLGQPEPGHFSPSLNWTCSTPQRSTPSARSNRATVNTSPQDFPLRRFATVCGLSDASRAASRIDRPVSAAPKRCEMPIARATSAGASRLMAPSGHDSPAFRQDAGVDGRPPRVGTRRT
jgi:hypothetical protein